jgi:hypothetical protein
VPNIIVTSIACRMLGQQLIHVHSGALNLLSHGNIKLLPQVINLHRGKAQALHALAKTLSNRLVTLCLEPKGGISCASSLTEGSLSTDTKKEKSSGL